MYIQWEIQLRRTEVPENEDDKQRVRCVERRFFVDDESGRQFKAGGVFGLLERSFKQAWQEIVRDLDPDERP